MSIIQQNNIQVAMVELQLTHRLGPETDGSTLARSSSRYDEYDLSTVGCKNVNGGVSKFHPFSNRDQRKEISQKILVCNTKNHLIVINKEFVST